MKYLFFIPETRDLADISLPMECHTSTCEDFTLGAPKTNPYIEKIVKSGL